MRRTGAISLRMKNFMLLGRLLRFRNELGALWRAFLSPGTPLHLKGLMLLVPLYLVSPIDLIPDVVPLVGWLDDAVIVPMLVSWIFGMLPRPASAYRPTARDGRTIDGDFRRL